MARVSREVFNQNLLLHNEANGPLLVTRFGVSKVCTWIASFQMASNKRKYQHPTT
jgi:hypothetical protein